MYITKTIEVDIEIDEDDLKEYLPDKEIIGYENERAIYQELARYYDLFGLDGLLSHLKKQCVEHNIFIPD